MNCLIKSSYILDTYC